MPPSTLPGPHGFNRCVRGREGYVLYNANDVYIGQALERYGEYSEREAQLLRRLCRRGSVVIDVGANLGTHTLVLANAAGPAGFVHASEPQRAVFDALCATLALNGIVNARAHRAIVGAARGWARLPHVDYSRPGNFGAVSATAAARGRKVARVTLDTDLDLGRLDLIKIDVEGMELDVLRGGAALIGRFRPVIYLENDRLEHSESLIRHLFGLDYRLFWHLPPLYNPDNFFGDELDVYPDVVSVNMLCLPGAGTRAAEGLQEVLDPAEHPLRARGRSGVARARAGPRDRRQPRRRRR